MDRSICDLRLSGFYYGPSDSTFYTGRVTKDEHSYYDYEVRIDTLTVEVGRILLKAVEE